ncbi:MAG TPA: hypothetical protein VFB12_14435 [Ktedonobacteraceae bacterium]|nr:hypothetical protein [Ktedonobacteraceae bacterium]
MQILQMPANCRNIKHVISMICIYSILSLLVFTVACGPSSSNAAAKKIGPRISTDLQTIQCPLRGSQELPNYLVLKTDRLKYDGAEIQQMEDYVQNHLGRHTSPPDTLAWETGAPLTGAAGKLDCLLTVILANTGDSPIILNNVQIQLKRSPIVNNTHYHLIDICSLEVVKSVECFPSCTQGGCGAGGGECTAEIALNKTDTIFKDNQSDCSNNITFEPKQNLQINIYLKSSENLTYTVIPQLSIQTVKGTSLYSIPKPTTLSFANQDQFSCYSFNGSEFVQIPRTSKYTWCL